MAGSAEQDNRVQIPNGTAAVNVRTYLQDESRSLEQSGKAEDISGRNPRIVHKSEDLQNEDPPFSAEIRRIVCHGNTAVVPFSGATVL